MALRKCRSAWSRRLSLNAPQPLWYSPLAFPGIANLATLTVGLRTPDSVQELHPSESANWLEADAIGIIGAADPYKSSNGSAAAPVTIGLLVPKVGPDIVGWLLIGRGGEDFCALSVGERARSHRLAAHTGKRRTSKEVRVDWFRCAAEPPVIGLPAIL
jgi:hypothetical protein